MTLTVEKEVMWGRRAFAMAQELFGAVGAPGERLPGLIDVGWHGSEIEAESGSFAVVRDGAGLDDLLGEVLRVSAHRREVFVYVLGSRAVPTDISLDRRAFMALDLLPAELVACVVEVVK